MCSIQPFRCKRFNYLLCNYANMYSRSVSFLFNSIAKQKLIINSLITALEAVFRLSVLCSIKV